MENIIINGDLYIKIAPTIVYKNTSLVKSTLSEFEVMELLTQKLDAEAMEKIQNLLNNIGEIMEEKAEKGEIKREKIEEYNQNIGFYRIFASENVIFLVSEFDATGTVVLADIPVDCENLYEFFEQSAIPNNVLDYGNINDVKNEFIRFYDFIMKSDFVGCYLEPKLINMPRYRILYEYLDTYLIQNINDGSYMVVSKKYPGMDDYVLGKKFDECYDKMDVYQDVFRQKIGKNRDGYIR